MVTFPNCKINLGLNIVQKREDNYHDLETVFFPIPFTDILEIISAENNTSLINTGISSGESDNNLCLKAFHLLKKDFPQLPEIKIHLHKTIPLGAGLGGGSSDAAFTLLLLNKKYDLKISDQKLYQYALLLGSDCPFFLLNKPCLATGRGEKMEAINLSLTGYKILLINPRIHINTKQIFAEITPAIPLKRINEIIQQPIQTWKNELKNDFEEIVFSKYPQIGEIKETLYQQHALYASMTGTGSSVYGIFHLPDEINYPFKKEYFHKWIEFQ